MFVSFVRRLVLVTLSVAPAVLVAQEIGTVRGRVTDAGTGQPIASVQVRVDDTALGALTDATGAYVVNAVPAGSRNVVARRIGYSEGRRGVQVAAGASATVDFALSAAATTLSEVVVTGTGAPTQRRAVGTSIGSVDSTAITRASAVTVDQALQGKIAGAQIVQNSGNPGGGGITMRLRGTSSIIAGSDPLYIIDGVIVDNSSATLRDLGSRSNVQNRLADINPADIERIEVIRGAAAAALYGSRANNGVVQIFTKRGAVGKSRITFQTRAATSELPKSLEINDLPFDITGQPVQRFDLQDQIFRTGTLLEGNLSVEGGNEQTRYYLNGTWSDEEGILESTSSTRKGGRINLSQEITPRLNLDIGANFVNTHSEFQVNGEGNGVLTAFLFNPTTYDPRPMAGVFPFGPIIPVNPLLQLERFRNPQDVNRFIGSMQARWNPLSPLTVNYTFGYDGYSLEQSQFFPRGAFPGGADATGLAGNDVRNSRIVNQDAVANLLTPWRDFQFTTSAGVNYTEQNIRTTIAQRRDLVPVVEVVSGGAIPAAGQSIVDLKTFGVYVQEQLAWRDRLYLTGAVRWDASSTFGPDERWQAFPKASLSYVASEDEWFRNVVPENAVSSLRFRTALGYAGNQPAVLNAYSRFDDYVPISFAGKPGVVNSTTLGNPELKPERQREWEVGADLGLLRERASVEVTYYDKLVDDLLFFRLVAPSTGYSRQFAAIGAMSNKGLELLLRTINVDRPEWQWNMTLTYARNRNRVERLDIPDFQSATGYPNRIKEGDPIGVFYGTYAARNCETGEFLLDSLGRLRPSTSLPTSIDARRALSGGACNDSTARILGDPNPDWLGSWLNELAVGRNLRFRVLLDGSFGNDVMNLSRRIRDLGAGLNSPEAERELLPYGDPRKIAPGYLARRLGIFSEYVEDGTFLKLRELSASYMLNQPWVTQYFSGGVEVTLSGRNLYTWTNYSGWDPEVNLFGQNASGTTTTAADRGFDFAQIPIPRTWSIGARFTY
ncbi:MAG: TonB-dependent receptor [Gemmatimonadota bacterium]|nr:TonB-dependent receptor [Gemmatimonadota bacterium]